MAKIKEYTKTNLTKIRKDLDKAVKSVLSKYGVDVTEIRCSYGDTTANFKIGTMIPVGKAKAKSLMKGIDQNDVNRGWASVGASLWARFGGVWEKATILKVSRKNYVGQRANGDKYNIPFESMRIRKGK
ncbi:hypothetical protein N8508_00210 [bacterium]|nr:hypothetical protein [bacterium]